MVQRVGDKAYFTFVKGLNTEASPFTFPENSSVDEYNFELLNNGARRRRLGLDYEAGYSTKALTVDDTTQNITSTNWRNAGGAEDVNFVVVQIGATLYFYLNSSVISDGLHATTISLVPFLAPNATAAEQAASDVSMASGKGYLFVTGEFTEPFYISYTPATDTITAHSMICKTRNFERINDQLEINTHPVTLSDEHNYNLLNQGWNGTNIAAYFSALGSYPSNSDIMSNGWKVAGGTGDRTFDASAVDDFETGSSPAPNGSLIVNVFDTSETFDGSNAIQISSYSNWTTGVSTTLTVNTISPHGLITNDSVTITGCRFSVVFGITDLWDGSYTVTVTSTTQFTITPTDPGVDVTDPASYTSRGSILTGTIVNPLPVTYDERFKSVAFYAGRAWYAGAPAAGLFSKVYFTQIISDDTKIGKFYQSADPTAEEDSQLVDTDGGYINIPEMGICTHMEVYGSKLLLFTTNGVYAIYGGAEDYFKATSFSVRKIGDFAHKSPSSVVNVDGAVLAFMDEGIYRFSEDPTSGLVIGTNMSETTIQTLFNAIPDECLKHVKGIYDNAFKRVFWTYSLDSTHPERHSRVLILDLRLQAWYIYSLPVDGGIYASGGTKVIAVTDKDTKIKLFTVDHTNNIITWSDFTNTSWLDFYTFNTTGTDAAAYIITGIELLGDVMRKKQVPYIFAYFKRSETQWISVGGSSATISPPSSCLVQFRWDFSDSTNSNKFTTAFQAYRYNRPFIAPDALPATFDPGTSVVVSKNRVRGVGKALQIKFYTEAGYDCYLYGWATTFSGYTEV